MKEIMVDLETLGLQEDAIILSIGAVKFDRNADDTWDTFDLPAGRSFYATLDTEEQKGLLRTTTQSTVDWWKEQSQAAKEAIELVPPISISQFTVEFAEFCKDAELLWANGTGFDCNKLRHLYHQVELTFPFKYNADRDLRTARELLQPTYEVLAPEDGVPHNALFDACWQVLKLQSWMRENKAWRKDPKPGSAIQ